MYLNKELLGGFSTGLYWSSSEIAAYFARLQGFGAGYQDGNIKNTTLYVRPVRAFS